MKVNIHYFKESGKWYLDEDSEWPEDKEHYTGWKPFEEVVRIKDMYAICFEAPLGFPQFCHPQLEGERMLDHIFLLIKHRAIKREGK